MTAQLFGCDKHASLVLFWLKYYNVDLGHEQKSKEDNGAEACAQAESDHLEATAEVEGYEGQPDDTRRVHAEADKFGLVEIGRKVAGFDGEQGAADDQENVVAKRAEYCEDTIVAFQLGFISDRISDHCQLGLQEKGGYYKQTLDCYQCTCVY